jgi:hypothetical protein
MLTLFAVVGAMPPVIWGSSNSDETLIPRKLHVTYNIEKKYVIMVKLMIYFN